MNYRRLLAVCLVTFVLYGFAHRQETNELPSSGINKTISGALRPPVQSTGDLPYDWLTFIESGEWDTSNGAELDPGGNQYVLINHYESEDGSIFDGDENAISITKIAIDGNIEWSVPVDAEPTSWSESITLDGENNLFVSGTSTASWGDPVSPYPVDEFQAVFIAKFRTSDGSLVWNTFLGSSPDGTSSVATDEDGNIYALWAQINADNTVSFSLAKLNQDGILQWLKVFIESDGQRDLGFYSDVTVDRQGSIFISTINTSRWGNPIREPSGGFENSIAKFDNEGVLLWNTFLGGTGSEHASKVVVDEDGFIYVSGSSESTWGNPITPFQQGDEAFLARLDREGNLLWNTFFGSPDDDDVIYDTDLGEDGNLYIAGGSASSWGDPENAFSAGLDGFAAQFDPNGALLWNTFLGGSDSDWLDSIDFRDRNTLLVSGASFGGLGNRDPQGDGSDIFAASITIESDRPDAYRDPGPLVPLLTTYIPTPLDISTDPSVIGANILLAILLMLPLAVAVGSFSETISEHEEGLMRWIPPLAWIKKLQTKSESQVQQRAGQRPAWSELLSLFGVAIFYGIVFSLLDETWRPFTAQGLVLLGSMTFSSGIIGFLGDILQWRALRKWGVPAEYKPGAGSIFVSLISVAFSRAAHLLPGLMFGSPDVLQVDETRLNEQQNRSLVRIGSATILVMAAVGWLPTIITTLIQRLPLSDTVLELIGAVEAFLLVLFAVAIEGLFLELLAISDGIGSKLKKSNRWVWSISLAACTFFFLHTLLNPRYGLVETLQRSNTRLFIGVTIGFIILTLILRRMTGKKESQ